MYQQHMQMGQQAQSLLPEEDMAYTVLADLKRVVSEYTTAATESSCPEIRGMFTHLMNDTLQMQGKLYTAMQQNNMYSASSPALRQEIDKQLQQNRQTQQKTDQHLQSLGLKNQSGMGGQHMNAMQQNQQYQQQQPSGQQQNPYFM